MDGSPATMTEIRQPFRTPLRILVPKLLKSRDDWKAKSDARKAQLKSAKITLRDLRASRELWRGRAADAQAAASELRAQLARAEQDRDAAAPKKQTLLRTCNWSPWRRWSARTEPPSRSSWRTRPTARASRV